VSDLFGLIVILLILTVVWGMLRFARLNGMLATREKPRAQQPDQQSLEKELATFRGLATNGPEAARILAGLYQRLRGGDDLHPTTLVKASVVVFVLDYQGNGYPAEDAKRIAAALKEAARGAIKAELCSADPRLAHLDREEACSLLSRWGYITGAEAPEAEKPAKAPTPPGAA
jgi:hypothetical protein